MGGYLLGIDNGQTVTKAVLYDLRGCEIAVSKIETPLINTEQSFSELDMIKLWQNTIAVIKEVIIKANIKSSEIIAIANCGHGNGAYLLDSNGRPFIKAITSIDHRATQLAKEIKQQHGTRLGELTLQVVWNGQPGVILKWLKINAPDIYEKIGYVLFCKDWIKYCLTGEITTDFSDVSASGLMNNIKKTYDEQILEILEIKEIRKKLPSILKSYETAGYITKEASEVTGLKEGTPVIAGLFDVDACGIGMGLIDERQYGMIAGTWNISMAINQQPIKSDIIRQCILRGDGEKYVAIDSSPTSSSNLEWFLWNVLEGHCSYKELEEIILSYSPKDVNIIFLPFIHSSFADDNPGGIFWNLRPHDTKNHMLRAVAEGICFAHYYHIKNLHDIGIIRDNVIFTGGVSKNTAWCKVFSDIIGMVLNIPESSQSGALGACMMAGIGIGAFDGLKEATEKMVRIRNTYKPDYRNHVIYQKKYKIFSEIVEAIKVLK